MQSLEFKSSMTKKKRKKRKNKVISPKENDAKARNTANRCTCVGLVVRPAGLGEA
jgi:hypothetical protein